MASKLTSWVPCIHKLNEGNFEWGAAGAEGSCEKVQWDAGRHSEAWLDGFLCDDSLFAIKCNSSATHIEDPEICKREHAELDWLSKEMAFQEFISSDRPTPWFDIDPARSEPYKDEHEADIVSTFTAVAALFRDLCVAEKDLPESVVNSTLQSNGYQKDYLDFSLEKFLKECYKNYFTQSGAAASECACDLAHGFCTKASREGYSCQKSRLEEGTRIFENSPQLNSKLLEGKGEFVHAVITEENISEAADNLDDCTGIDLCSIFGKQTSAASRFSFGRDSDGESGGNAEVSEISGVLVKRGVREGSSGSSQKEDLMALSHLGQYQDNQVEQVNTQGDDPVPEGLLYTLAYMNLHDLLKMEQVCRYLRNRIKNDVLLWQRLHIELPMSNSLTDEVFLELASRSRGQLQCLSLVDCTRVTEAALEEIVLANPRLVQLSLPGCSRISADAVVRMVERHTNRKFSGVANLKQLRIRNMDGFTKEHLDKLQKMVGVKTQEQSTAARKPQFYHQKHYSMFQDDDRAIDVEECPMCTSVRLVYDCTREKCQQKKGVGTYDCRACILCIVRCEACGRCITDNDYEETFSLDVLCSCCWLGSPKCAECNRPASECDPNHLIRTPEITTVFHRTLPETEGSKISVCP
ncbi:hypothetical protein GOP47_0011014 [Adiantum capillus-veneris]|uniref:F-box domain-containing protein n=1 Tax=Adiantum capillus-veneris TaxID=13818 RepID=A0A9D4ZGX3_ADICA|nr:hypothetical protein GOP47_0011014 [Adiantum capillus-veneris]